MNSLSDLFRCPPRGRLAILATLLLSGPALAAPLVNWPQFRGPGASGVSPDAVPLTWNMETGENVRWETPLPGLGHASPIIWGDRIYVATAVKPGAKPELKVGLYGDIGSFNEKEAHQWRLLALDKRSGKILWNKLVYEAIPRTPRHTKATHCNSTPATDGEYVVAFFGSEGLYCFGMDGAPRWHKDLGKLDAGFYAVPNTHWGFASSPVLYQGKVIIQCDVAKEQFLAVLDERDGKELWRTKRAEVPTWSTPLVATGAGRTQIIANGWKQIAGYDFATGKEFWHLKEGGDIPVASPVLSGDMAILTSGHGTSRPMRAVRLDATGDITPEEVGGTNQAIAWSQPRKGNYLETPIAVGELVWGSLDGIITCFDRQTGKLEYSERLGGGGQGFTASPVAAKGRIYFTGEQGNVFVVPAAAKFSVLATNKIDGICLATPAISEGALYFRTTEKLIAIGSKR